MPKPTFKKSFLSVYKVPLVIALFAVIGVGMIIKSQAAPNPNLIGDLNSDNVVNLTDLSMLLSNWGKTAGSTPTPTPTPPTTPPTTPPSGSAKYPADITDALGTKWKVTLPVVSGGKVVEIKPPEYATYTDKYFHLNDAKNGVVFDVWHGGGTTSGSSNPRSELRERYNDDPEGYWDASKGTHTLEVTGQVNRLTKVKPQVVIAQVHDHDDDTSVWRVEGGTLYITQGNEPHHCTVDSNFKLGVKYTLKYVVTNGNYEYYYNGNKVNCTNKFTQESYFKAGNYLQSNPSTAPSESTSEYSEVVIYSVKVTHS